MANSAPRKVAEPFHLELPPELYLEVSAKAGHLDLSINQTVVALLRMGLREQTRREAELEGLVNSFLDQSEPEKKAMALDRVGEAVFGK